MVCCASPAIASSTAGGGRLKIRSITRPSSHLMSPTLTGNRLSRHEHMEPVASTRKDTDPSAPLTLP